MNAVLVFPKGFIQLPVSKPQASTSVAVRQTPRPVVSASVWAQIEAAQVFS